MITRTKKVILGLLVILAVGGGVVWGVTRPKEKNSPKAENQVDSGEELVRQQDVEVSKLPDKFPAGIPVEEAVEVTENFNAENDSVTEAVRSFKSKKSLDDNFALYNSFLKKDGWTIKHTVNNSSSKIIFAEKGDGDLQIGLYNSAADKVVLVNLIYTVISRQ